MPTETERLSQAMAEAGLLDDDGNLVEEMAPDTPDIEPGPEPSEEQSVPQLSADEIRQLRAELEDQKRRNAGLQRKLQPTLRENQILKDRLQGIDEQIFASTLQSLPPAEREQQLAAYRAKRDAQQKDDERVQLDAAMEAKARALTIWELSQTFGVNPDLLDRVKSPDPDDMELLALHITPYEVVEVTDPETGEVRYRPKLDAQGQPVRKAQPQAQPPQAPRRQATRFESSSGSPVAPPKAKTLDDAARLFVQLAKQRGIS